MALTISGVKNKVQDVVFFLQKCESIICIFGTKGGLNGMALVNSHAVKR